MKASVINKLAKKTDQELPELTLKEQLIASEVRYRRLFESAKDGILILDAESGKIIDVNPFLVNLLGFSKEEFIEKEIWEIGFFKDIAANKEKFLELQQQEYVRYENLPLETFAGRKINVEFVSNVYLENHRKIIQCNIRDITDRKKKEDALIKAEAIRHLLLRTIPDLIWLKDKDGVYLSCNRMFERFFGGREADIVGKTDYDFIDRELADFFRENDRKAMTAGKSTVNEEWITFPDDGHRIYLETIKTPVYDVQNELIGVLGIGRDITVRKTAEKALRQSEEKYRMIVETTAEGIWVVDKKWKTSYVNPAMTAMLGYASEELLGHSPIEFVVSEDVERANEFMNNRENGITEKTELLLRRKDGTLLSTYGNSVSLQDETGTFAGRLSMVADITEIKRVEKEILFLAHSLKSINECVSITDLNNKIVFVNESFLKTYGYNINELVGENIEIVRSRNNPQTQVNKILPATILGEWQGELLNIRKDGSEFPIHLSTSVIRDKESKVLGLIGVATDISGRKRAEELLRESEERLRLTLEETQIGTFDWDIKKDVYQVSDTYYTMLGYKPKEGYADRDEWLIRIHPDDRDMVTKKIQTVINGLESNYQYEARLKNADGLYRWIYVIGHIIKWDENNKPVRLIGVRIDITERKFAEKELIEAKEKAEESDRLKSAFLSNMSHEIRTPMNGILGFTELLKEQLLTGEQQQEYISIIEKSGARLLNIINDIVSISRIESGQIELSISETNINELIEYIFNFFKPDADYKKLHLSYKNALPEMEAMIKTDIEKVTAILTNLVNNAIKFTYEGSIEFGYEKKGNWLEFFVKDTGIGVPHAQKELIFERFRQGSESLTRNYEGAGLGLSISKAYVEIIGGKIWIESDSDNPISSGSGVNNGSTFHFTIPYYPKEEVRNTDLTDTIDNAIANLSKNLKILIIDDDRISEQLLSIAFNKISRNVLKAGTGLEAVNICRNNPDIDLVLMDIKMPDMDGYEATRLIRKFNKSVIIIAQTAYGLEGDREKAIEAGCNEYLAKPVRIAQLNNLIKKLFI